MLIPFFKSHYSINKSILTLDSDHEPNGGPRSIIALIKEHNIKNSCLVDDNLSGFLEAYTNSKNANIKLNFGVRLTVCENILDKNPESIKTEHKIIVFLKKSEGYDKLFGLYSFAATEGFYYIPRIDLKSLKSYWNNDYFSLVIPYYDSFLFNNALYFKTINLNITDFPDVPFFVFEKNDLFFEKEYSSLLMNFVKANNLQKNIIRAKSIFYNKREDFLAYLTMRCIGKKSSLQNPNLDFMSSDNFCLESFLENEKNG